MYNIIHISKLRSIILLIGLLVTALLAFGQHQYQPVTQDLKKTELRQNLEVKVKKPRLIRHLKTANASHQFSPFSERFYQYSQQVKLRTNRSKMRIRDKRDPRIKSILYINQSDKEDHLA